MDASDVTTALLFGESDTGASAVATTKVVKDDRDTKEEADAPDPLDNLRRALEIDGLGKVVAERLDVASLQEQVIRVVDLFLSGDDIKAAERFIIDSAMSLWATLISDPNKEADKKDGKSVLSPEFLVKGLIKSKDIKVRECFRDSFRQICGPDAAL